jgi:hypothetical protein
MNNLLVPIHFLKTSINALSAAEQIVRISGGSIYIVRLIAIPTG